MTPNVSTKPVLRGHFHQEAFFVSVGACMMLIYKCTTFKTALASTIYSLTLMTLLGVSALYHRINWSPRKRLMMRRLDHSAIYLFIAGSMTPVCMLALSEKSGTNLLLIIWAVAILGFIQSMFFINAPKWLSAILYIIAGYLIVPYFSELKAAIAFHHLVFIVLGGVAYTLGGLAYALKRPKLSQKYFGYHEVFHILVIVGAVLHFIVMDSVISNWQLAH